MLLKHTGNVEEVEIMHELSSFLYNIPSLVCNTDACIKCQHFHLVNITV